MADGLDRDAIEHLAASTDPMRRAHRDVRAFYHLTQLWVEDKAFPFVSEYVGHLSDEDLAAAAAHTSPEDAIYVRALLDERRGAEEAHLAALRAELAAVLDDAAATEEERQDVLASIAAKQRQLVVKRTQRTAEADAAEAELRERRFAGLHRHALEFLEEGEISHLTPRATPQAAGGSGTPNGQSTHGAGSDNAGTAPPSEDSPVKPSGPSYGAQFEADNILAASIRGLLAKLFVFLRRVVDNDVLPRPSDAQWLGPRRLSLLGLAAAATPVGVPDRTQPSAVLDKVLWPEHADSLLRTAAAAKEAAERLARPHLRTVATQGPLRPTLRSAATETDDLPWPPDETAGLDTGRPMTPGRRGQGPEASMSLRGRPGTGSSASVSPSGRGPKALPRAASPTAMLSSIGTDPSRVGSAGAGRAASRHGRPTTPGALCMAPQARQAQAQGQPDTFDSLKMALPPGRHPKPAPTTQSPGDVAVKTFEPALPEEAPVLPTEISLSRPTSPPEPRDPGPAPASSGPSFGLHDNAALPTHSQNQEHSQEHSREHSRERRRSSIKSLQGPAVHGPLADLPPEVHAVTPYTAEQLAAAEARLTPRAPSLAVRSMEFGGVQAGPYHANMLDRFEAVNQNHEDAHNVFPPGGPQLGTAPGKANSPQRRSPQRARPAVELPRRALGSAEARPPPKSERWRPGTVEAVQGRATPQSERPARPSTTSKKGSKKQPASAQQVPAKSDPPKPKTWPAGEPPLMDDDDASELQEPQEAQGLEEPGGGQEVGDPEMQAPAVPPVEKEQAPSATPASAAPAHHEVPPQRVFSSVFSSRETERKFLATLDRAESRLRDDTSSTAGSHASQPLPALAPRPATPTDPAASGVGAVAAGFFRKQLPSKVLTDAERAQADEVAKLAGGNSAVGHSLRPGAARTLAAAKAAEGFTSLRATTPVGRPDPRPDYEVVQHVASGSELALPGLRASTPHACRRMARQRATTPQPRHDASHSALSPTKDRKPKERPSPGPAGQGEAEYVRVQTHGGVGGAGAVFGFLPLPKQSWGSSTKGPSTKPPMATSAAIMAGAKQRPPALGGSGARPASVATAEGGIARLERLLSEGGAMLMPAQGDGHPGSVASRAPEYAFVA